MGSNQTAMDEVSYQQRGQSNGLRLDDDEDPGDFDERRARNVQDYLHCPLRSDGDLYKIRKASLKMFEDKVSII